MGTSSSSSGSGSDTPLVPSWLDKLGTAPLPGDDEQMPQSDKTSDSSQEVQQDGQDGEPKSPLPKPAPPGRFQSARANFSRFASSSGTDQHALRRAVRDYVRTGTGGSKNAVRRMALSSATAGAVLGALRGLQRDGMQETLHRLNLQNFSGSSVQDIFTGLTEVVCQDGGTIDEATARNAWLETIAELDQLGIDNPDSLTEDQVKEIFLNFIAHSIEVHLYQEIGVNGFKLSKDLDGIEVSDREFRGYIKRSVRDSFSGDMSQLSDMSNDDIKQAVNTTYLEAWELLEQWRDEKE